MDKYLITQKIENFAPTISAEPWDCVGFMVETNNRNISKIMICLTPTEDVFKQALEQNCDMVVSHHPMFYINCNSVIFDKNFKPIIDIYSAHTNMDKANGGTTDTLIKAIGLDKFQIQIPDEFLRYVILDNEITIENFAQILAKISPNLRFINNKNVKTIKKILFCAGSGSEFIKEAKQYEADCLVTGDLKFHTALDSQIVVFDIGHFESEILIREVFKEIIGQEVEIIFAQETSPFTYYKK